MYGLIYCAQNLINEKRYIGQTTSSLKKRIKGHKDRMFKKNENVHFHNALKKYGLNNFMWTILCYSSDKEALDKAEIYWIKDYNTMENGYNHQAGGYNGRPSLIARKKMSESSMGQIAWNKGKTGIYTEEQILNMKNSHIGHKAWNKGIKTGIMPWMKGKHHTAEANEKNRQAHLGQKAWNKGKTTGPLSYETCLKMSLAKQGIKFTEEHKLKQSIAAKKAWADPEIKGRKLEAQKQRWENYHGRNDN